MGTACSPSAPAPTARRTPPRQVTCGLAAGVKGLLSAEQHKIVSQQAFVDLHTPWEAPDAAEGGNYALGWLQNTALDRFFHDGSYQGFRTIMLGIT